MRRRWNSLRGDEDVGINLTPMIDIVFIMLIFFIVTASFVKESGIAVDRPGAETAVVEQHVALIVAIDADDGVWVNHRRIDVQAVRAYVERMHLENPQGAVVIQADKRSSNGTFVKVLDQVRLGGVEKISVAATVVE